MREPKPEDLKALKGDQKENAKKLVDQLHQSLSEAARRCLPVRVAMTSDGSKVIGVTSSGVVQVFDAKTGKSELTLSRQGRIGADAFFRANAKPKGDTTSK